MLLCDTYAAPSLAPTAVTGLPPALCQTITSSTERSFCYTDWKHCHVTDLPLPAGVKPPQETGPPRIWFHSLRHPALHPSSVQTSATSLAFLRLLTTRTSPWESPHLSLQEGNPIWVKEGPKISAFGTDTRALTSCPDTSAVPAYAFSTHGQGRPVCPAQLSCVEECMFWMGSLGCIGVPAGLAAFPGQQH